MADGVKKFLGIQSLGKIQERGPGTTNDPLCSPGAV
jgi:hypothetical protein